jgi:hypothetical protein
MKYDIDVRKELKVNIVLSGSGFDYMDVFHTQPTRPVCQMPKNLTDFVVTRLLDIISDPSPELLTAFTTILECDPQNTIQFLPKVFSIDLNLLVRSDDETRRTIFGYMEIVVTRSRVKFMQFMPMVMFAILNQGQTIEPFLAALDKCEIDHEIGHFVVKRLILLVQNVDVRLFIFRFARTAVRLVSLELSAPNPFLLHFMNIRR